MLGFGGGSGANTPVMPHKKRFGDPGSDTPSQADMRQRVAAVSASSASPAGSPAGQRAASASPPAGAGGGGAAGATRDEKVEKIRVVAKAVIEQDIRPKIQQLKASVDSASSIPVVQPLVLKVKSLKNDFEVIKTILPAIDKLPTPERAAGEDALVSLKKVVAVIIFEYDLVLGIALTVSCFCFCFHSITLTRCNHKVTDVASSKDLVTLVGALKKIKALLQ